MTVKVKISLLASLFKCLTRQFVREGRESTTFGDLSGISELAEGRLHSSRQREMSQLGRLAT